MAGTNAQAHALNKICIKQVKEELLKTFQAALWRQLNVVFSK